MPRPSHVRDAIARLVSDGERHDWTREAVLAALAEQGVRADFSSVCRGLAHLERTGMVRRVYLGDGRVRYEAHREHHDHIQCERCHRVAEIPECVVADVVHPVAESTGYMVFGHQLTFLGVCPACSGSDYC